MTNSFSGRIVLVTGASRGIGRAAAIALGAAGALVVCVARSVSGLEETCDTITEAGGRATSVALDMRDFASIDRIGPPIFERWGRLDGYIGNAGILGVLAPLANLEPEVFTDLVNINVIANWRLIRALDPLLRRSDAGRVLFITSGAARKHVPLRGGYAMSKAALESLVLTYAAESESTNLRINLLNPGPLRTAMRAQAAPDEDPSWLQEPEALAPLIVEMLSPSYEHNGLLVNFQS